MRTTIDIPDSLYRTLKARAGLGGITLRDLIQRLIEQGLHSSRGEAGSGKKHQPPPVIIPPRGVTIPEAPRAEIAGIKEEDDEARHA